MNISLPLPGTTYGNYLVKNAEKIPELNLGAIILQHEPTGARHLHLACDDPNNVFAVGFKTPPPDSTGIAHILEHTVLCGSQKYPVRDPFFAMLKRSLNTFMNALTAADWTLYPVASMNRADFYNLMGIYLDATFFPMLREQDFRQEGHRFDFADENDPDSLMIKGVVFNEMKGAMADPSSLLNRRLNAALFPTTCYGHNSGGEPLDIPNLTWEQLRNFHKTYYHPSNSWIFTYGDMPLEEHLQQIDNLALKHFSHQDVNSTIPLEKRLQKPLRQTLTFPIGADEESSQRSMVQLAWLNCPIEDTFERAATGILANLLLGNPAAPLYQALIESGLGKNLSPGTGYHDDYRDTFIAAGLQGIDADKVPAIEETINTTLEKIAREGFPQERIDAALHQYEFANKEVTGDQYPYGLGLLMRIFGPWLHADDSLSALKIENNLKQLREATRNPDFFPELIRRNLLDNPHRVTLLLTPDKEHSQREEQAFAAHLSATRKTLSDDDITQIKSQNAQLQENQETPDDTSCLPILELSDINPEEQAPACNIENLGNCKSYWFEQPTNGITYLGLQFDVSGISKELRRHLPIYCALLPQLGAAGHDYLAMSRRISAFTGGVRLGTNILENPCDLDSMRPVIELRGKALDRNQEQLNEILRDMLTSPDFTNHNRLRTVINQVKTSMENSVPGAGHSFAARCAASGLTPAAAIREEWNGMTQLQTIQSLSSLDDQGIAEFAAILTGISQQIFTRDRLSLAITAEEAALNSMRPPLQGLLDNLNQAPATQTETMVFDQNPASTAWLFNLPVAYVAQVFRTVPYTHPDAPALLVLAKLLRAEFLHREIREKGGAYGGMAGSNSDGGLFSLLSYRDPHIERTFNVYRQAIDWVCSGELNDEMIKESILTSFADLDRPLAPGSRGYREFLHQQQGKTHDMIQSFRQGVLEVTREKLVEVAKDYLKEGVATSASGILAGDNMLRDAQDLLARMKTQQRRLE
jgi:Zn-dependent M16 (insulinase) family peptidase